MSSDFDPRAFWEALVRNRLVIPTAVSGAWGRGAVFEDVLARFNNAVTRLAADDGADVMMFPPIVDRATIEKSGFIESFPQLAGTVFSFTGTERQGVELGNRLRDKQPWAELQSMTDVALTPAACYPAYPTFTGTIPADGRMVDMTNWVYRHEPSPEPTRLQSFRVREFIRVGTPAQVVDWRNMWLDRGVTLLKSLGLPAKSDVATDPFFGRGGKMMAASQREQALKFEVLVPVISAESPTACCSFNYHQDKFGSAFDIKTEAGDTAHTACLGFGLERVTLAMFKTHGMDPKSWPADVRKVLFP
jgi:seryl-tRNA synthetase